jgi:glycosyltransferase involved in cell wall biosynthesis
MLARLGDTWIITRANNAPAIELALPDVPEGERMHFVYVDLPGWARFWKRGQRGVRLYYLIWQVAAVRRARRLQRDRRFDVAWHLTLANAWLGSLAPLAGLPFVYGPVGGGVPVPWHLAPALGVRGTAYEVMRAAARAGGRYANPTARLAWRRADLILVQNSETARWLPRAHRERTAIFPNVVIDDSNAVEPGSAADGRTPTALFAGRLLPWKGVALAIRAVALVTDWKLLVAGSGFDERRLRRLARRLGVGSRVVFLGWCSRDRLHRVMREDADVFLYPSLREDSGWVVAEALGCGLPVLCLDRGGPPDLAALAGIAIPSSGGPRRVASSFAGLLVNGAVPGRQAAHQHGRGWSLDARADALTKLLRRRLPIHARDMRGAAGVAWGPASAAIGRIASGLPEGMEER